MTKKIMLQVSMSVLLEPVLKNKEIIFSVEKLSVRVGKSLLVFKAVLDTMILWRKNEPPLHYDATKSS